MKNIRIWSASFFLAWMIIAESCFAISEGGAIFLMIRPGARPSGMGSAFVAIADDATATYFNPAGLGFINTREVALMHSPWLNKIWRDVGDLYYEFIAYVQPISGLGTVGGNVIFLSEGQNPFIDDQGIQLGTFSSYEFSPHLSYGTKVGENLGVGINMKIIYSHLVPFIIPGTAKRGVATTWAVDLGVLYKVKNLSFGAMVQNIGPKLVYITTENADPLSRNLRVGAAYKVMDNKIGKWTASYDVTKLIVDFKGRLREQMREAVQYVGTEFIYSDLLALRTGFVADEVGRIKGPTFGGGLKVRKMSFDFALEPGGELQDYNQKFSFSAKF